MTVGMFGRLDEGKNGGQRRGVYGFTLCFLFTNGALSAVGWSKAVSAQTLNPALKMGGV